MRSTWARRRMPVSHRRCRAGGVSLSATDAAGDACPCRHCTCSAPQRRTKSFCECMACNEDAERGERLVAVLSLAVILPCLALTYRCLQRLAARLAMKARRSRSSKSPSASCGPSKRGRESRDLHVLMVCWHAGRNWIDTCAGASALGRRRLVRFIEAVSSSAVGRRAARIELCSCP